MVTFLQTSKLKKLHDFLKHYSEGEMSALKTEQQILTS